MRCSVVVARYPGYSRWSLRDVLDSKVAKEVWGRFGGSRESKNGVGGAVRETRTGKGRVSPVSLGVVLNIL